MSKIICVASHKNGSGKTTTAVNLSSTLAISEKKTLIVDCDPRGNATSNLGIEKNIISNGIHDALIEEIPLEEIIQQSSLDFLQVIPAISDQFQIEKNLSKNPDNNINLRNLLKSLSDKYEYIIIDTPPESGFLTSMAMVASDSLLITLECQDDAFDGLGEFLENVKKAKIETNPGLKVAGILFTMCEDFDEIKEKFSEEALSSIRNFVCSTTIPADKQVRNISGVGKPLVLHDIMSKGSIAYLNLAAELINRL